MKLLLILIPNPLSLGGDIAEKKCAADIQIGTPAPAQQPGFIWRYVIDADAFE